MAGGTVHPEVRAFLDGPAQAVRFPREALTVETASRDFLATIRAPKAWEAVARHPVFDLWETRTDSNVPLRVYEPTQQARRPVIVFFHGGGWVTGDLELQDSICRLLCERAGASVVSVDYRLAPEHPFPAPFDDCFGAFSWVRAHAAEHGWDTERMVVAGSSAGGNLAAAVAIRARDEGIPLALQLLVYPALDASMTSDSIVSNGEGYYVDRWSLEWYWKCYLADRHRDDPLASPSRLSDARGLAPAIVGVAEFDPLRDEGLRYADMLRASGVPVDVVTFNGQIHGFLGLPSVFSEAEPAVLGLADLTRTCLAPR